MPGAPADMVGAGSGEDWRALVMGIDVLHCVYRIAVRRRCTEATLGKAFG